MAVFSGGDGVYGDAATERAAKVGRLAPEELQLAAPVESVAACQLNAVGCRHVVIADGAGLLYAVVGSHFVAQTQQGRHVSFNTPNFRLFGGCLYLDLASSIIAQPTIRVCCI